MIIRCPHCNHELTREEAKHISRVYAGSATSEKKKLSSAENGKKGGRPKGGKKKPVPVETDNKEGQDGTNDNR